MKPQPKASVTEISAPKSLDDRIADAFETTMSSVDLKSLLDEVRQIDAKAKAASEAAAKIAFDPAVRPAKVDEARKAMENADFRSRRMTAAIERLTERHQDAIDREKAAARKELQDRVLKERALLVMDLKAQYPDLVQKLVTLMQRLSDNNAHLVEAFGLQGQFQTAEIEARGLTEQLITNPSFSTVTLVNGLRLPKPSGDNTGHPYAWPPQNPHL